MLQAECEIRLDKEQCKLFLIPLLKLHVFNDLSFFSLSQGLAV